MVLVADIDNGEAGLSVRTKLNTLIAQRNPAARYYFTTNSGDEENSMTFAGQGLFSVDDIIETNIWFTGYPQESGGKFVVAEVNGTATPDGDIGDFVNDSP